MVFTLPSELNGIVYQNQNALYNLLFKASAETLSELALDKKYLGARIGFTSVLHTWGQNLVHHKSIRLHYKPLHFGKGRRFNPHSPHIIHRSFVQWQLSNVRQLQM